jgi:hypothetical protein
MKRRQFNGTGLVLWLPLLGMQGGCVRAEDAVETVGVPITGVDHLAEHLSIQDFWVNGARGHQAGGGGSTVCCATLAIAPHKVTVVRVRWAVTNWKRRVYGYLEREVPLEVYDGGGPLYVHFLSDGGVRAVLSETYPEKPGYPGPSYATVLTRKQPWEDYQREIDEPRFAEVPDPMKG